MFRHLFHKKYLCGFNGHKETMYEPGFQSDPPQ